MQTTTYHVWRQGTLEFRHLHDPHWHKTNLRFSARGPKEAETKMRRKVAGMGLHMCRLVALPAGTDPNKGFMVECGEQQPPTGGTSCK